MKNKKMLLAAMALVGAQVMPTSAFAAEPWTTGTKASVIYVMNTDPTGAAAFQVDFYQQGTLSGAAATYSASGTLNYKASTNYNVATIGALPAGWQGSVVISADKKLASVVKQTSTGNANGGLTNGAADGISSGAYGSSTPANTLYFPYVTSNPGIRFSILTVQNTEATAQNVTLTYRNTATGAVDFTKNTTIEGYRSKSFNLGDSASAEYPGVLAAPYNYSVVATSAGKIVGTFSGYWQAGWETAYSAATAADTKAYAINVFRRNSAPVADPIAGSYLQWSNLFIQNTGATAANVTIKYIATGAATPAMTVNASIAPGQAKEFNTRYGGTGGTPSTADFNTSLGNTFAGAAIIESDQPVAAVVHSFWGTNFFGGGSETAVLASEAATTYYVPYMPRNCTASCANWSIWGKIAVVNTGAAAANVAFDYVDANGTVLQTYSINGIAPGAADALNTRFGSDGGSISAATVAGLGDTFGGGVVIRSTNGQPIIATTFLNRPDALDNAPAFKE